MIENIVFSFLQISLSCSFLIILLLCLRNVISKRYYAKTTKLLWTIIAVRLLLPIGIPFIKPIYTIQSTAKPITPNAATSVTQTESGVSFGLILFLIWILGMILYISIYFVNYNLTSRKMYRWSTHVIDKDMVDCFHEMKKDLKIKKKISLKQSNYISSPVLIGLFKVTVYIPNTEISPAQLPLIFKHELLHYKKKDIWFKFLIVLVTALHWFNPLVYIMANKFNADIETACDEAVLHRINYRNKKEYANAILRTVELNQKQRILLSTHFSESSCTIRKRLDQILVYRKRKNGVVLCTMIATILLSAGSLIGLSTVDVYAKSPISSNDNEANSKQYYLYVDDNNTNSIPSKNPNEVVIITYEPVEE